MFEPHTRCKPSGGPRQFITPTGTEIVDDPELGSIYIFDAAGPQTFRVIYMDGREHPKDLNPVFMVTRLAIGKAIHSWSIP